MSTVRLVWNVREASHISWIAPLINDALAKGTGNLEIALDVYVTRGPASAEPGHPTIDEADPTANAEGSGATTPTNISSENMHEKVSRSSSNEKVSATSGLSAQAAQVVSFHKGRSPVENIIRTDVTNSNRDADGVAVSVCGPTSLANDTRRGVVSVNSASKILAGQAPIEFFSETFDW